MSCSSLSVSELGVISNQKDEEKEVNDVDSRYQVVLDVLEEDWGVSMSNGKEQKNELEEWEGVGVEPSSSSTDQQPRTRRRPLPKDQHAHKQETKQEENDSKETKQTDEKKNATSSKAQVME